MLALSLPDVRVVGISCVHGNTGVAKVAKNVARVLALCGRSGDVPIYLGAEEPLVAAHTPYECTFHGDDGLGDGACSRGGRAARGGCTCMLPSSRERG